LAILIGKATATLSQQMIAKIDTPEAREIYGQRLAIVEPVFGNLRSQKRLDRFTLRGKITVNIQWLLYCMVHNIEKLRVVPASLRDKRTVMRLLCFRNTIS
jgi:hypothetical protein